MRETIKRAASGFGLHVRRQAIAYVALAVALGGSAYAGNKAGSDTVGARDLKPLVERFGAPVSVPPGADATATATCKPGERALTWYPSGASSNERVFVRAAAPAPTGKKGPKGGLVVVRNDGSTATNFSASVLCLRK